MEKTTATAFNSKSNLQALKSIAPSDFAFLEALFSPRFQYLSAERVSPKSTFPVSDYDINTLNSIGNKGEYTAHFLAENGSTTIKIKTLVHKKAKSETLLAQADPQLQG